MSDPEHYLLFPETREFIPNVVHLDKNSDEYGAFVDIKDELTKYFDTKFPSLRSNIVKLIYDKSHFSNAEKHQRQFDKGSTYAFKPIPKKNARTIQLSFF